MPKTKSGQVNAGSSMGCFPIDRTTTTHFMAEHDILADTEIRTQVHFLVDGRNAGRLSVSGSMKPNRCTFHRDLTVIDPVNPGEGLNKCRLSGTVFAHQCVNFTGEEPKIDVVQGFHA